MIIMKFEVSMISYEYDTLDWLSQTNNPVTPAAHGQQTMLTIVLGSAEGWLEGNDEGSVDGCKL